MFSLLAESAVPTPPEGLATWLGCLTFVLYIADKGKSLMAKKTAQDVNVRQAPDVNVNLKATYVTHEEFQEVKQDVKDIEHKLDTMKEVIHSNHVDNIRQGENRANKINARIDAIVAALKIKGVP